MKPSPWLRKFIVPNCTQCGAATSNTSLICTICRQTCPQCGLGKSYHAKICLACRKDKKKGRKKGKRREKSGRRSIPTAVTLDDGAIIQTRSKLEASWVLALQHCPFICYECRPVPCLQTGKFGPFTGKYLPDLLLQDKEGNEILCEIKPTAAMAISDTRPQRALALNPLLKFIIIGGEPHDSGGFFLKLLSAEGVKIYETVQLSQFLQLFNCE